MLVKVRAVGKEREEMKRMADIFRGRIIDVTEKSYTIELTGDSGKNDAFCKPSSAPPFWKRFAPGLVALVAANESFAFDAQHSSRRNHEGLLRQGL